MNMRHRYPLSALLMLTPLTYAMENKTPSLTPEQVTLTISNSDNPVLDPLKVELTMLGDHIQNMCQSEVKKKDDDDATAGAAQLMRAAKTPFNTPTKRSPREKKDALRHYKQALIVLSYHPMILVLVLEIWIWETLNLKKEFKE